MSFFNNGKSRFPFPVGKLYILQRMKYRFAPYFENEVLRKRPYLKKEWCIRIVENYEKMEMQENNRYRFWGKIQELDDKYIRVVTLEDKVTILNAFPDRGYKS